MQRDWICTDNHSIRSKKDDQSKEKQPCEGFYRLISVIFLKHCNFWMMIRLDYDNILSDSKKSYQRCALEFGRSSHLLIPCKEMISHIMNL